MNVLIVDDIAANRKLLRVQLEAEGIGVCEAKDGIEALDILNRESVGAIVSDILMPRMNGYHFCLAVRKDERFQLLPFVFFTATYTSPSDEHLALSLGADAFLTKPVSLKQLLPVILKPRVLPRTASMELHTEESVLYEYTDRLAMKLEEKNLQLERRQSELEKEIKERYLSKLLYSELRLQWNRRQTAS